jgi:hypothetical protein
MVGPVDCRDVLDDRSGLPGAGRQTEGPSACEVAFRHRGHGVIECEEARLVIDVRTVQARQPSACWRRV